jgi:2-C-methyl-D-erythritol 4-phosphate cytidylyltransferase
LSPPVAAIAWALTNSWRKLPANQSSRIPFIVAREDRHREIEEIVGAIGSKKMYTVIEGGEHRHDSVRAGLEHLSKNTRYVAVHDAARPLVTSEQIENVFTAAQKQGAASLAAPVADTLKRADADLLVKESVERDHLFAMQTPQIFERKLLEQAYRAVFEAKAIVTDEVSAVERAGKTVVLVSNDQPNFKITYPADLELAELVLSQRAKSR